MHPMRRAFCVPAGPEKVPLSGMSALPAPSLPAVAGFSGSLPARAGERSESIADSGPAGKDLSSFPIRNLSSLRRIHRLFPASSRARDFQQLIDGAN